VRDQEWIVHIRSREEWAKRRVGKARAVVDERMGGHNIEDKMMDDFLREQNALTT
jgi:hypothetical protein